MAWNYSARKLPGEQYCSRTAQAHPYGWYDLHPVVWTRLFARIDTWADHLLGRIDEVLLTARMAAKRAVVRLWSVRIRDLVENEPGWRSTTSESRVRGA